MSLSGEKLKEAMIASLGEKLPGTVPEFLESRGETYLKVEASSLIEVCTFLRDDPEWHFAFLAFVSGVDWLGSSPRFEVVYHLRSIEKACRIGLKVPVPDESLAVPSVTSLWSTADWMEREVFDLYGITFTGHPNLKRIMMPDEWEGHPYRKDFPLEGRN